MSASEILQNLNQMSAMMAKTSLMSTDADGHYWTAFSLPDLVKSVEQRMHLDNNSNECVKQGSSCSRVKIARPDVTLFCPADDDLVEETEYFVAQSFDSNKTFLRRGSVRGVKDGVKSTIEQLKLQTQWTKKYEELDRGKVVVYITSFGVVRPTWEKCRRAVSLLENHRVYYERRDLALCNKFVEELKNRSGQCSVDLPKIYIDGQFFGGVDKLEQWSEVGELKRLLEPYKRTSGKSICSICYGFRFLPCTSCRGGKKSSVFCVSEETKVQLRCAHCDSCGLVECTACSDGYHDG